MQKPARSFEDLVVWQKAHALVIDIYTLTAKFPREEVYGLTAQMRRAAVSMPANIAEGFRRRGRADKARLLNVAEGSLDEVRYYLRLARDLRYTQGETFEKQTDEIARLLAAYVRPLLSRS